MARRQAKRGLEAFAFQPLALHLAGAAHGFGRLAGALFARLLKMPAQLHFPKNAFALHLLLERLERLINIVVANENLHLAAFSFAALPHARPIRNARMPKHPGFHPEEAAPISHKLARPQGGQQRLMKAVRMALLKIARMGHPVLLQRAAPVADPTAPEIRRLVADMIETMLDAPGIGLAAPQVHVPLRLFVFHLPAERAGAPAMSPTSVINPTLEPVDDERVLRVEGCLSIPGLRAAVPRWVRIRYQGVDTSGAPVGGTVDGLHANVVQHEFDHLDGILYPMRITDFASFGFNEELARFPPSQDQAA